MTDYEFTAADRDERDRWVQQIAVGGEGEALWNLFRLQIKHDTAGLQMTVRGYEDLLRQADAHLAQVADLLGKLVPLVERVAVLEAQIAQAGIDRKELRERVRTLEHEVALLKTRPWPVHLSDAPGD